MNENVRRASFRAHLGCDLNSCFVVLGSAFVGKEALCCICRGLCRGQRHRYRDGRILLDFLNLFEQLVLLEAKDFVIFGGVGDWQTCGEMVQVSGLCSKGSGLY